MRQVLLAAGGGRMVELYNADANEWIEIAPLPEARVLHSCAPLFNGQQVLCCGGQIFGQRTASCVRYQTSNNTWLSAAPMRVARQRFAMAALNGYVYVAGADSVYGGSAVVEKYDMLNNKWLSVRELQGPVSGASLAGFAGHLWLLAKSEDASKPLYAPLQYNPETDRWMELASYMRTPRYATALIPVERDGHLYAVGGYAVGGGSELSSTERYNLASGHWEMPAQESDALQIAGSRRGLGGALVDGRLMIAGGHITRGGKGIDVGTVERLRPRAHSMTGRWVELAGVNARPFAVSMALFPKDKLSKIFDPNFRPDQFL